jgi:hypothetical protein
VGVSVAATRTYGRRTAIIRGHQNADITCYYARTTDARIRLVWGGFMITLYSAEGRRFDPGPGHQDYCGSTAIFALSSNRASSNRPWQRGQYGAKTRRRHWIA